MRGKASNPILNQPVDNPSDLPSEATLPVLPEQPKEEGSASEVVSAAVEFIVDVLGAVIESF